MSVIGRLDKQVEDVLISPLSKTRPAPEKVPSVEPSKDTPAESVGDVGASEGQTSRERAELPVWLL
ncbi:MAG TPA: hypothetical protein VNA19_15775 [Pyrinomonadaceae bacterium]|jgi:hypothetical protein|nr:hypothetical protein [Pyrinomonadaceae bacterium]